MIKQSRKNEWKSDECSLQRGVEALRRIPEENGFDRIKAVVAMHRRMSNADGFKLVMDELRSQERDNAWELIAKGTHETGPTS